MTFAHWEFDRDSSIHKHFQPHEEVWEIVEGLIELTVEGCTLFEVRSMFDVLRGGPLWEGCRE